MMLKDLQKYIEKELKGTYIPVDLLKISKSIGYRHYVPKGPNKSFHGLPNSNFTLVVDGECCLDRLYGGFFSDWVCGGQWKRMVEFLSILVQTVRNNNIELTIFLNGALEKERFQEWIYDQSTRRKNMNSVLRHLSNKNTPPPKVWWVSPFGIRTCLRLVLRELGIPVVCSMDDHRLEVIAYCRDNDCHGLVADDVEYIIFDPPRYFSSQQLKLTYKGSWETKEVILNAISKGINLPRNYFCFLAALLSNFILSEDDLRDFYLLLIPTYDKNSTSEQEIIIALSNFIVNNCDTHNLQAVGTKIFGNVDDPRIGKFIEVVQYYMNGTRNGYSFYPMFSRGPRENSARASKFKDKNFQVNGVGSCNEPTKSRSATRGNDDRLSPSDVKVNLPVVSTEVIRTASERHQKGLMCPWIYQVLTNGEVKFDMCFQDEECSEFPNAILFYQQIRQCVYAVIYNLHHLTYLSRTAKEDDKNFTEIPDIRIKEWFYSNGNSFCTPMVVKALAIKWAVPTVQRLWFGSVIDDKKRRLRAFLSCVGSDSPLMLNTNHVPQHLLIMATVLRYIMSSNEVTLLRKQELDAFIVTAFSSELNTADFLQELKLPFISSRSCQLASFFMVGVEMVIFANDACGSPIPWLMCCPWLFFDGKLFHSTLLRAEKSRSLIELCEGNVELTKKVERCRQAILEGLWPNFVQPVPPLLLGNSIGIPPLHLPPPLLPSTSSAPQLVNRGGKSRGGRSSSGSNIPSHLYSRGGQLEVAGVVVGSWGPNYGSSNHKNEYGAGASSNAFKGDLHRQPTQQMERNKFNSNRGRSSAHTKRLQIKEKDSEPAKNKPRLNNEQQQQGNFTNNETSLTNGHCEVPPPAPQPSLHHHHTPLASNAYTSNYNNMSNVSYNPQPPYNLTATSNPSYVATTTHYSAFHPDMMHHMSSFQNQPPPPPPTHHHHTIPAPPINLQHAQNLYGTPPTNGYKSPDSGVNVSIME